MKPDRAKLLIIALFSIALIALAIFNTKQVGTVVKADDTADLYKAKCVLCHKPTAEKFFDAAKTDDVLIEAVLKGKKAEKPPNMPAFEEKGINKDQAALLVAYMRKVKTPTP